MFIKIALTEDIVNQCLELHYGDQPAGKKLRKRLFFIPLVLTGLGVYLLIDEWKQPGIGLNFFMAILYIGFAISYYFFMKKRLMKAGKRLVKNLGVNANFTIEINGNELKTTTPTYSNTLTWQDFTGALVSSENILLYQTNNTFTMFNYTFFTPGDFEIFKADVRSKVRPVIEV